MQTMKTYRIDEAQYNEVGEHRLLLETTQYKIENEILTKQIVHARLQKALPVSLFRFNQHLPHIFYFMENSCQGEKQIISRSMFEQRLSNCSGTPILHEVIEALPYKDRFGKEGTITFAIVCRNGGVRTAEIAFQSPQQMACFSAPPWLVPIENDT